LAALTIVLGGEREAAAATFYVRTTGSDSNDGTAPSRAFRTITKAAANAIGRRGHTVYVGAGRYAEGVINPAGSGARGKPIQFVADRDGSQTGDAGDVLVDAATFSNAFRIARPWVVVNGFSITGATTDGIDVKSGSHNAAVANCRIFSNGGRGIRVRDSAGVVVFNNLIYANGGTGADFTGDREDASDGVALNNTLYANGNDGLRFEGGAFPLERMTALHNVIANNSGIGLNLKEPSATGFVGQWNLVSGNLAGAYATTAVARGELDVSRAPLLVSPAGTDGKLGGTGYRDDDFHLDQSLAGQAGNSAAVDASAIPAKKLGLGDASTRSDGTPDAGNTDLGFHAGSKADFVSTMKGNPARRLKSLRKRAMKCNVKAAKARSDRERGRGACANAAARARLARKCGPIVLDICG
jgi:parallel beta-helix repeat protein